MNIIRNKINSKFKFKFKNNNNNNNNNNIFTNIRNFIPWISTFEYEIIQSHYAKQMPYPFQLTDGF